MAWIESHQELATHPKLLQMARELRVNRPTAIGMLHLFWWWALDAAPDGNITGIHPVDIGVVMTWNSTDNRSATRAQSLYNCLIRCGWIDAKEGGTFIHNWQNYTGKLTAQRESNKERQRVYREKLKLPLRNGDVTVTKPLYNGATVPYSTVQNSTVQNRNDDKSSLSTPKIHYGEFQNVLLVPEDYEKLVDQFGQKKTDGLIERLSAYMTSKGKRYKNHYATLLAWDRTDSKDGRNPAVTGGDADKFAHGKFQSSVARSRDDVAGVLAEREARNAG